MSLTSSFNYVILSGAKDLNAQRSIPLMKGARGIFSYQSRYSSQADSSSYTSSGVGFG